jgi:hypothetical protein
MENSHRLARKYFKCNRCKNLESQLIHPNKFQIKCSSCGKFLNEIPEKEYKTLKNNKNYKVNKSTNDHDYNLPYRPPDAFKNISSVYNRPPSNLRRQNNNTNEINYNNRNGRFINNNNINNNNNSRRRNQRYQSTNHYSDINIINNDDRNNNINNNNRYSNNINNESNSRINNSNNNSININIEERGERPYGQGARNRSNSQEPSALFGGLIGSLFNIMNITPIIISSDGEARPYHIVVQSQNVSQNIFDPLFLAFGAMFDNNFRNNFSSNFRSNFRGNFLSEIIRILERNQEEAARKAHPPTSVSALKKLKRFPLSEKYCKKDKKGKLELPSCCICLNDIEMKEETVLLPCGHMFHWDCCLNWLKGNNTCPMCRFVIKD